MKDEQQSGALVALQRVDDTLQQAVLDEWAARCQAGGIRNPAGYLFAPERDWSPPAIDHEAAQQHLTRLHDLFKEP